MKRYGSVIKLKEDRLDEYKRLHADAWPEVLAMIDDCNIRNYSIYLRRLDDGEHYLFSHYEYHGDDYESDITKMAADPVTQRWWAVCMPCQTPLDSRNGDEWWSDMEEVFYHEGP